MTQEVGYQHGKTVFDVWRRSGVVEKMLKDHHQEEFHNTQSRNNVRKKQFIFEPLNYSSVDKTAVYTQLLLERQTLKLLPPSVNWQQLNLMRSRWAA